MTIEQKGVTVTGAKTVTFFAGVLRSLVGKECIVGMTLNPDPLNSSMDNVIFETSFGRAQLRVGPEINTDPTCQKHRNSLETIIRRTFLTLKVEWLRPLALSC